MPGEPRCWSGTAGWASRRSSTPWCRMPFGRSGGSTRSPDAAGTRRRPRDRPRRSRTSPGWVVDTPGVRSFGLAHIDPSRVIKAFPDLDAGTGDCPRGCSHDEPECGLDAWVATGHASGGAVGLVPSAAAGAAQQRRHLSPVRSDDGGPAQGHRHPQPTGREPGVERLMIGPHTARAPEYRRGRPTPAPPGPPRPTGPPRGAPPCCGGAGGPGRPPWCRGVPGRATRGRRRRAAAPARTRASSGRSRSAPAAFRSARPAPPRSASRRTRTRWR